MTMGEITITQINIYFNSLNRQSLKTKTSIWFVTVSSLSKLDFCLTKWVNSCTFNILLSPTLTNSTQFSFTSKFWWYRQLLWKNFFCRNAKEKVWQEHVGQIWSLSPLSLSQKKMRLKWKSIFFRKKNFGVNFFSLSCEKQSPGNRV